MPGKLKTPLCIALSAAVLFAASCAEPGRWRKSAAGQGGWNRDKAACQSLARKETEKQLFESCLKNRGYSPAEEAPKKD